jgi:hypothetical protein
MYPALRALQYYSRLFVTYLTKNVTEFFSRFRLYVSHVWRFAPHSDSRFRYPSKPRDKAGHLPIRSLSER